MLTGYFKLYEFLFGSGSTPDTRSLRLLKYAILTLPSREQKILDLMYGLSDGHRKTLKEIAKHIYNVNKPGIPVTPERIRQLQYKAGRRLRSPRYQIKFSGDIAKEAEEPKKPLMDKSVYEFGFTIRTENCLRNAGIKTVGELVAQSEQDLLKSRNFGRKSLIWLKERLAEHGLHLRGEIITKEVVMERGAMLIIIPTVNGFAVTENLEPVDLKDVNVFETSESLLNWLREKLSEERED